MGVTDSSTPLRPTGQLPVSPATDPADAAGRDINITWWYTFLSIAGMSIFLLGVGAFVPISLITASDGPTWQIVVVLVLFTATCVTCVYASWLIRDGYGAGWPPPKVTAWLLAIPGLALVVTIFIPGATLYGATPLWVTLSILLALVPRSHRLWLVFIGLAAIALHGLLNPGTAEFIYGGGVVGISLLVLLTPTTFLVSGWLWHLITRLDGARTVNSQLAVARERLRFASDLHDIQGHHLQVIALKAELADRLLATQEPTHLRAAQESIAEVRALAEQAQSETRQLVRDLRVVSLPEELANAKDVLAAAGIDVDIQLDPKIEHRLTGDVTRLFGLAVREATTNILRHANATSVGIRCGVNGSLQLIITNDGVEAPDAVDTQGTGIAGLRTRFAAVNGNIMATRHDESFTFQATLPMPHKEQHA
ncbi:hypothetical protein A6F49_01550 [Enteractinococcus helveticum]|uniref:Signal transduction histidine kinase subgroup 3 dimerisation and phosphoacceptor domain-containing protein n=1 Tax=Enteractinococcus helveticum TaxID=1837282 RepID=A0A1B7LV64_9MICC|nr:hypothetical protein A6F49_01550 [Enteractinococcus helveticum]